MRAFLLLLCGLWWAVGGWAQEAQYASYRLEAELDAQTHTLRARQTVDYPNDGDTPLPALYFLLVPNFDREPNPHLSPVALDAGYWNGFDPAWLEVKAVRDGEGNALEWRYEAAPASLQTFSLERALLRVALPEPLAPRARTTVVIEFETKFPARLSPDQSVHRETYTWRFAWNPVALPAQTLNDGQYLHDERAPWIYPAALYELTLTVPLGYEVAAGLNRQELITQDEETQTFQLASEVPVRSVALSLSPRYRRYTLAHRDVPITVYYFPGEQAAARQIATYAADVLDAYSARWGAYGYKRLTVVSSWVPGLFGMAADGLVILGNGAFREKDLTVRGMSDRILEYLVAHELAHQWWGIGVGTDFNAENYLSEAMAEYLSITYFEDKYGADGPNVIQFEREGLLEDLVESQLGYLNLRQHFSELSYLVMVKDRFDEALVKPQKDVYSLNTLTNRVYNKGYLVLRALAGLIGPEQMDRLLLLAYQRYNHRLFRTEAFQALAEEQSGQDLDAFFTNWVYGDAQVDYAIQGVKTRKDDQGQYQTQVTLSVRGRGALPVQVVLLDEAGETVERTWQPERDGPVLTFTSAAPPKEIEVDPHSWTPDTRRLNNFYPTRIRVIPDGKSDLPLDAYLIRVDPMTQSVEGGFLLDYRWQLSNGLIAFIVNQGRGNTLDGTIVVGPDLQAEFGWNLTRYHHPDLGFTGQYWEPSERLRLSLSRRLDADGRAVNYAGISYRFAQSLTDNVVYQLSALSDPLAFVRLSAAAAQRSLLAPHLTLDLEVRAGYSLGRLPGLLRFTLDELNGFYAETDQGKQKQRFPGRFKVSGRVGVNFPIRREMAYSVAGLALTRQLRGAAYLAAGESWNEPAELSLERLKAEVGLEVTAVGQMFGGLFPFNVTLGLAMPLLGRETPQAHLELYVRFSLPLF